MKITKLTATNVHGYLPINVEFFSDLTFITGLNGSGKTSALRLLMALLTPNIDEFAKVDFAEASVTVAELGKEITIKARKTPDILELATSELPEPLILTSADLQLLINTRDDSRNLIQEKVVAHPTFQSISKMSTPMFLGLDRRFNSTLLIEDVNEQKRRELMFRRFYAGDSALRNHANIGLVEVNYLVSTTMQEIRATQEQLDDRLRNQILAGAFKYKPSEAQMARGPSRIELERYRERQTAIERAAEDLRLPLPDMKAALAEFFESMNRIVTALEQNMEKKKRKHQTSKETVEWIINKPQADRILEHIKLLDAYGLERSKLRAPIDKFLGLVNGFLAQTEKSVQVTEHGELVVILERAKSTPRPITALSSGERQIVVMLSHLSLNRNLAGSGVFIVDEPELSLHIGWQEKFVEAIRAANPSVQLILATHSPAIILDKDENCRSLNDGKDKYVVLA